MNHTQKVRLDRERVQLQTSLLAYRMEEELRVRYYETDENCYAQVMRILPEVELTDVMPVSELIIWLDGAVFGIHWEQVMHLPQSEEVLESIREDIIRPMGVQPPYGAPDARTGVKRPMHLRSVPASTPKNEA